MGAQSAVEKFAALHSGTEIWWDSSPLVYARWQEERGASWRDRPDLLDALARLGDFASQGGLLCGSTTNPPLAWKAIQADQEAWDTWTYAQACTNSSVEALLWRLYGEVCDRGARMLEPKFVASAGRYGHICGQVDPRQLTDLEAMLAQARGLRALRPNVMIKMPATQEGIKGIRILASEGISTTATLCFSVSQLVAVAEAAQAGFDEARRAGVDLTGARSCAALMLGRMEEVPLFAQQAVELGLELSDADLRWAGVAVARKGYELYRRRGYETRLLCASMRLGPVVDGSTRIWHLEQLAGGEMVMTIFPNILASFIELYADRDLTPRIEEPVPAEVLDKLLRIPYFAQAYDQDAIPQSEYINLPGVRITGAGFAQAMQSVEDYAQATLSKFIRDLAHARLCRDGQEETS